MTNPNVLILERDQEELGHGNVATALGKTVLEQLTYAPIEEEEWQRMATPRMSGNRTGGSTQKITGTRKNPDKEADYDPGDPPPGEK